jgi:hypothetical protein
VGTPVCAASVEILERAIEDGVRVQPFVKEVDVHIDRSTLRKKKRDEYDYQTLHGNMLRVRLRIQIENVSVLAEMRYIDELRYPLMFISEISEV